MIYAAQVAGKWSGYTQASMLYLAALEAAGRRDVSIMALQGVLNWNDAPRWAQGCKQLGAEANISRAVGLLHMTPDNLMAFGSPAEERNIGLTVVETDTVPRWMCERLNRAVDGLIVTCEHNRRAFEAGGFTQPTRIVPHPMHSDWWTLDADQHEVWRAQRGTEAYTFLWMGVFNERKGPENVIRAFCRAFPEPGKARLLMKISGPMGFKDYIAHLVEEECGSTDRLDPDTGDIFPYLGVRPERFLRYLYVISDCYVSLHRGEGWGLGLHQAAAVGRPVIYTNWSAPPEFLPVADGHMPVKYDLVMAGRQSGNMPYWLPNSGQTMHWAQPNLEHAVHLMRLAADQRRTMPTPAVDAMRERFSLRSVGHQLSNAIEELA